MEVWNLKLNDRSEQPQQMKKFIEEVIEIMKKYNMSISHEDSHGAFIIEKYDKNNIRWFREAMINL